MYVFPRITEKADFKNKVGNLIYNSSFVPVLEIDNQASNQAPPILINDGITHKYRTSFDGLTSEVNFFFFFFFYDNKIISELLSELICIQIERFAKIIINQETPLLEIFLNVLSDSLNRFVEIELKQFPSSNLLIENVKLFIQRIAENFKSNRTIPKAPSQFTTIIPKEGLKLKFDDKNNFSSINYQIF
jgi:frataxin-like iron-binding protein CyaY